MGDGAVELLINKAKAGDKGALEQLTQHIWTLRHLVTELSEGLDDCSLEESVSEALGWDEKEDEVDFADA